MATLSGGKKFEEALLEIAKEVSKPGTLKIGFLEGNKYPDGTSVAQVAFFNEFGRTVKVTNDHGVGSELGGTYYQLPRPFFRNMIAKNSDKWPEQIANVLKTTKYDTHKTLMLMGEEMKGQLQESIQALVSPPLAPSTIERKGFDKPLIDTGLMFNKVAYEVN